VNTGALAGDSVVVAPNDSAKNEATANRLKINAIAVAISVAINVSAMAQTMPKDQYQSG